jgi:hypothetical protein
MFIFLICLSDYILRTALSGDIPGEEKMPARADIPSKENWLHWRNTRPGKTAFASGGIPN